MKKKVFLLIACLIMVASCLLTACGSKGNSESNTGDPFDETDLANGTIESISGDYQAVEQGDSGSDKYVAGYWHLYIGENDEKKPFLSIYDNGAGNPGVEGLIVDLTKDSMTIEVDPDMYEELPSAKWELDDGKLELTYEITVDSILLTNHKFTVTFMQEGISKTIGCRWKSQDPQSLRSISFENEQVYLEGWICDSEQNYSEENISYWLSPNCMFFDDYFEHEEMDQEGFAKLLERKDLSDAVIEMDMVDDPGVLEIRLIHPEESSIIN